MLIASDVMRQSAQTEPSQDTFQRFFVEFDGDIRRSALSASVGVGRGVSDDVAQEVRLHLFKLIGRRGNQATPFLRRVIANSARKARAREARYVLRVVSIDDLPDTCIVDARSSERGADPFVTTAVAHWVARLPFRLQRVFELIYVEGCTQREIAQKLGITQARVAQLHSQLLVRGKEELSRVSV